MTGNHSILALSNVRQSAAIMLLHTVWLRQLSLRFTINWPARSSLMIPVITQNIG
nr:MAG TPA: hypothetical protein [Caudoviricetes sp.]